MPTESSKGDTGDPNVWVVAVEGGGTSFKVALCKVTGINDNSRKTEDESVLSIPVEDDIGIQVVETTSVDSSHDNPQKCLDECCDFIRKQDVPIAALGIATFGPVGVNPDKTETYGCILNSSPKAAWRNVDLLTPLQKACACKNVMVDTDVNAPAVAEYMHHNKSNNNNTKSALISSCAYVTVGTGVGVGLVLHNGMPVHGRMHPEGGHIPVQPLPQDPFPGYSWGQKSPYKGIHTVEGIASSVALSERYLLQQQKGDMNDVSRDILATVPDNDPIWDHCANALANLCVSLFLTVSIEKIVLGGGILQRAESLMPKIHARTIELLNGYLPLPRNKNNGEEDVSSLITTSTYGSNAGLVGAIVLAYRAYKNTESLPQTAGEVKHMKREAFGHGLWHGFLVGVVATGLIVKYVPFFAKQRSPRR